MMQTLSPTDQNRRPTGFTLFEMLVVLSICGIVAAIAVPRLGRPPGSVERTKLVEQLRSAAHEIRRESQATGRAQQLSLDMDLGDAGALTYEPLIIREEEPGLIFYPDGSASGGRILLDRKPLLEVDWLTGALRESTH